jgi:iron complex transport system ATP-binding protein
MNNTILKINDLEFTYNNKFSLSIPSLEVSRGEFLFVMGLNGSGKTTFMHVLAHLLPFHSGDIQINGCSTNNLSPLDIALHVALVEQEVNYVFPYTVLEVILMGRYAHQHGAFFESEDDLSIAREVMEKTDIIHYQDRLITELSGGERRRVEIARALAQETDIILLDEPTAFLDIRQQRAFLSLIKQLNSEGKTILFISHRLDLAQEYADRIIVMENGRLVPEDVDLREVSRYF